MNIRNIPHRQTEWERENQRNLSESSILQAQSPFHTEKAGVAYGKQDAIRDAWGDKMQVDLTKDDCETALLLTVRYSLLSNPCASMEDFLQLKEKGLDGSVNWSGVSSDFSEITNSANGENLKESIDYFASRYVALASQISRTHTGQELEDQLAKLEEVFAKDSQKFASSYASRLKKALGISDQTAQSAENSLGQLIRQRISDYQAVQKTLDIELEPDEQWLRNHDKYMAAQLRQAAREVPASHANADFTLADLQWASEIAGSYQSLYASVSGGGKHHTEFYVLSPAIVDMKTEALADSGILSQNMSAVLRDSMENRHRQMSEIAHTPRVGEQQADSAFDYARFKDIYSRVLDVFHRTGDAVSAIREGGRYIQKTAHSTSVQYRYEDFFAPSGNGSNGPKFNAYKSNWEAFQKSLESQKGAMQPTMLGGIPHLYDSQFVDAYA